MAAHEPILQRARDTLTCAILSDALDGLGLMHQIMSAQVRPLDERLILCGRARTGSFLLVGPHEQPEDIYEPLVVLVNDLQPEQVMVLACGPAPVIAPWGELLSAASVMRGAVGCVSDGPMRDVRQIRNLGFPVFSAGYGAIELWGRGRLVSTDEPVQCGGVSVAPGDLVFGDVDGVAVIPRSAEQEVLARATAMAESSREIVAAVRTGQTLRQVYRRFQSI